MDAALARAPDYAPAQLYRGQWLLDLGRAAEAGAAFRRATELAPQVPAGWIGLARTFLARGDARQAARVLEDLLRRYDHPQIHQLLGLAYRAQGDLDRARAALARGRPGPPPGWPDPWHDEKLPYQVGFGAGMVRAEQLMDQGRLEEAIARLEALRAERPGDVALLNNLSVLYRRTGRAEEGLRVLEEALETHPDYFPFHLNLASAYHAQGDLERALSHLDRVLAIHPSLGRAHEQKATYLMKAGRSAEALASFDAALRHDAGRPQTFYYAGLLEADLGHWPRAVERMERALELDPSIGPAWVVLARVRAEQGQREAAERALEQAERLAPDNPKLAETRKRVQQLRSGAP
jgi:tetratricopeptide (TPR) repeat protein